MADVKNITMVKEASGSMDAASQIIAKTDLTVLSGDDSLTLPLMALGGQRPLWSPSSATSFPRT